MLWFLGPVLRGQDLFKTTLMFVNLSQGAFLVWKIYSPKPCLLNKNLGWGVEEKEGLTCTFKSCSGVKDQTGLETHLTHST